MKRSFPWLALGLGLAIALLLMLSGATGPAAERALPLLTLLIVTEFGFFLTAIGAGLALRDLARQGMRASLAAVAAGCAVLAVAFLWLGIQLWPGGFPLPA